MCSLSKMHFENHMKSLKINVESYEPPFYIYIAPNNTNSNNAFF